MMDRRPGAATDRGRTVQMRPGRSSVTGFAQMAHTAPGVVVRNVAADGHGDPVEAVVERVRRRRRGGKRGEGCHGDEDVSEAEGERP